MANRGDYNATLPRSLKRMLSLTSSGNPHQDSIIRKLWIGAHSEDKRIKNLRLMNKIPCTLEKTHQKEEEIQEKT